MGVNPTLCFIFVAHMHTHLKCKAFQILNVKCFQLKKARSVWCNLPDFAGVCRTYCGILTVLPESKRTLQLKEYFAESFSCHPVEFTVFHNLQNRS